MIRLEYEFEAALWLYPGMEGWHFITLPADAAEEIRFFHQKRRGFGSIRVSIRCSDCDWRTSIFPDKNSGSFIFPVKASVRKSAGLMAGKTAQYHLAILDEPS
ncbi:MAG: hypothetical protein CMN47_03990 [SAR116 cluster bacterium]|nr:hypothetical protein [SAR116 cluster bacterium]